MKAKPLFVFFVFFLVRAQIIISRFHIQTMTNLCSYKLNRKIPCSRKPQAIKLDKKKEENKKNVKKTIKDHYPLEKKIYLTDFTHLSHSPAEGAGVTVDLFVLMATVAISSNRSTVSLAIQYRVQKGHLTGGSILKRRL